MISLTRPCGFCSKRSSLALAWQRKDNLNYKPGVIGRAVRRHTIRIMLWNDLCITVVHWCMVAVPSGPSSRRIISFPRSRLATLTFIQRWLYSTFTPHPLHASTYFDEPAAPPRAPLREVRFYFRPSNIMSAPSDVDKTAQPKEPASSYPPILAMLEKHRAKPSIV